jgi:hypothetical protein
LNVSTSSGSQVAAATSAAAVDELLLCSIADVAAAGVAVLAKLEELQVRSIAYSRSILL